MYRYHNRGLLLLPRGLARIQITSAPLLYPISTLSPYQIRVPPRKGAGVIGMQDIRRVLGLLILTQEAKQRNADANDLVALLMRRNITVQEMRLIIRMWFVVIAL